MTDLALKGCTYEPMSSYLSALAVLRLVSEQKTLMLKAGGTILVCFIWIHALMKKA